MTMQGPLTEAQVKEKAITTAANEFTATTNMV
jgi:hypothetical protein